MAPIFYHPELGVLLHSYVLQALFARARCRINPFSRCRAEKIERTRLEEKGPERTKGLMVTKGTMDQRVLEPSGPVLFARIRIED